MVAITVTETPAPNLQLWDRPPGLTGGIPYGQVTFQSGNDGVVIPAATADTTNITITCALAIGWVYRLMDARVMIRLETNEDKSWTRVVEGQLLAFNPGSPDLTTNIPFNLQAFGGLANAGVTSLPVFDISALPFGLIYQPATPLPNVPLVAQSAITSCRLALASISDTTDDGLLRYYLRFLVYTIEAENRWAINTPVPVTF